MYTCKADLGRHDRFKEFALTLQKEEADNIVVTTVAALIKIDPEFPVLTIHDAIYVPESKAEEARRVMEEAFIVKYGVSPRLEIVNLRDRKAGFKILGPADPAGHLGAPLTTGSS